MSEQLALATFSLKHCIRQMLKDSLEATSIIHEHGNADTAKLIRQINETLITLNTVVNSRK